jgi:hypothetical protein
MIQLLDEVINKVKMLSESEQERIALLILNEISQETLPKKTGILNKLKQIKIQGPANFTENIVKNIN